MFTPSCSLGRRWRSSTGFIIATAMIALFSDNFLYSFIVPIMSYMVEFRLHLDPSVTQRFTTILLTVHGFTSLASAPIIAHFADKTPNRKIPLLISLAGCVMGTILVSWSGSVWALFLGRILQASSGSAVWIVAFATLADNVDNEHMGKVMGMAMSFVTAGITLGPVISGSLLQLLGYWAACAAPLILLTLDCIARLVMIEKGRVPYSQLSDACSTERNPPEQGDEHEDGDETAGLLSRTYTNYQSINKRVDLLSPPPTKSFYCIVLRDPRILAGLVNTMLFSAILSAFDTTLPIHLRILFDWGSLPVGMIFFGLQIPGIFLGTAVGWMRDRFGLLYPTTFGWIIMVPMLWLLAVPGQHSFEWANPETNGKAIVVVSIVAIGVASVLIRGAGTFQVAAICRELQSKDPTIFGSHGGNSRIFSMTEVAFNLGMMLGPLVSGSLKEAFGYYIMSCTFVAISFVGGLSSFVSFTRKPSKARLSQHD